MQLGNYLIVNFDLKNYFLLTVLVIFFISTLTFIINKICFKFQILDFPNKRKDHKLPIPVSGGIVLILSNFIFYIVGENIFFINLNFYLSLILISSIFFSVGIFDDIKSFNTNYKIIVILSVVLIILTLFDNLVISELRFKYIIDYKISLGFLSIPFTLFCIFMFFNALNYSDGKNGICISYSLFFVIFLSTIKNENQFFYLIIITLIILLIFNLRNKLFLGNNGVNFLSIFFKFKHYKNI